MIEMQVAEGKNNTEQLLKVGLIINPVAGLGGAVALKGSDGVEIVREALRRGALPKAQEKVSVFLQKLKHYKERILFMTYPMAMGEAILQEQEFRYVLLNEPIKNNWVQQSQTLSDYTSYTSDDTRHAARQMAQSGVDVIVFAGGDGTARNIAEGLTDFPEQLCLGIPAGVKIHSAVYAINPGSAADLLVELLENNQLSIQQAEVRDIDEEQLRQGIVNSKYYADLWVPKREGFVQCGKQGAVHGLSQGEDQQELQIHQEIAAYLNETLDKHELLIVGAGKTTFAFKESLGIKGTLLGVDVIQDGKLLIKDAQEGQIKNLLASSPYKEQLRQVNGCSGPGVTIVVSVIGGQGCIFGRGNQQISAGIIRQVLSPELYKERVILLATRRKIANLPGNMLFLDTGDALLDAQMSGLWNVLVDYDTRIACRVRC